MRRAEPITNVFEELGFADPKGALVKAELAVQIGRILRARHLTQQVAAARMNIPQAKVSSIIRGDLHGISETKLQSCLNLLGHDVRIVVSPHKGKGLATTSVIARVAKVIKKPAKKPKAKPRKTHEEKEPAYA